MFVARIAVILRLPEPDGDAGGHFQIAQALVAEPTRLELHWAWLPGYHYLLSGLIRLGATLDSVRMLNAALAALMAILVYRYARLPAEQAQDAAENARVKNLSAWLAALFVAVAPVVKPEKTAVAKGGMSLSDFIKKK